MRESDTPIQKLKRRRRMLQRLHRKIHQKLRMVQQQIRVLESEPDSCLPDPTFDLKKIRGIRKEDLPR